MAKGLAITFGILAALLIGSNIFTLMEWNKEKNKSKRAGSKTETPAGGGGANPSGMNPTPSVAEAVAETVAIQSRVVGNKTPLTFGKS